LLTRLALLTRITASTTRAAVRVHRNGVCGSWERLVVDRNIATVATATAAATVTGIATAAAEAALTWIDIISVASPTRSACTALSTITAGAPVATIAARTVYVEPAKQVIHR